MYVCSAREERLWPTGMSLNQIKITSVSVYSLMMLHLLANNACKYTLCIAVLMFTNPLKMFSVS